MPLTNARKRSRYCIGMARKKNDRDYLQHRSVVPARHSTNANPMGAGARPRWRIGARRRSSIPTLSPIWTQPKSSLSSQCTGKWRSLFRECAPTSELKPNANGPKTRLREPHQYCSASTVWFVSGGRKFGNKSDVICRSVEKKMTNFTFSDAIAAICYEIHFFHIWFCGDCEKKSQIFRRLLYGLCFTA